MVEVLPAQIRKMCFCVLGRVLYNDVVLRWKDFKHLKEESKYRRRLVSSPCRRMLAKLEVADTRSSWSMRSEKGDEERIGKDDIPQS